MTIERSMAINRIELEIKNAQDRSTVAGILVDNGYRTWTDKVKKGTSKTTMTVLCADKPEKGGSVNG